MLHCLNIYPFHLNRYDPIAKDAEVRLIRKARQTDHELKYTEALVELEQQVTNAVGPELKDKMWNERYEWWLNEVKVTGKAPKNLDGYYKMLAEKDKKPESKSLLHEFCIECMNVFLPCISAYAALFLAFSVLFT